MAGKLAADYNSGAQRARVVTESWGESNLYCPNCSSPKLTWLEPGHPASDYSCPKYGFWFQLKSQRFLDRIYRIIQNQILFIRFILSKRLRPGPGFGCF
jgi:hypothetical protein